MIARADPGSLDQNLIRFACAELRDTIASDAEVENANDGQTKEAQPEKVTILDALVAFCQQL